MHTSAWRHWGCVTGRQLKNMAEKFDSASDLDGYEDLSEADQAKISKAWADGHVADEDIPDSARKPEGEEEAGEDGEEKPKKKRAPAKKKKAADAEEDGDAEEKPKAKRAPRKKAQVEASPDIAGASLLTYVQKKEDDDNEGDDAEKDADEDEKPKKKRAPAKKAATKAKAPAKKRAPKKKKQVCVLARRLLLVFSLLTPSTGL
jgi:hypothetical protein